ncbi:MAG: hypothetical protein RLZZ628_2558 [Bacteroidota bacterium]|jgi:hypothetical protein
MDSEAIKILIEKYFEGETSLEEEAQLSVYFNSDRVGEDLKKYQPLFVCFKMEKQIVLPTKVQKGKLLAFDFRKILKISRVAAILLLAVGSFWWFHKQKAVSMNDSLVAVVDQNELNDTEESPEMAYQKAKAALLLVSSKMKRGTDKGVEGIHTVKTSLDKIK